MSISPRVLTVVLAAWAVAQGAMGGELRVVDPGKLPSAKPGDVLVLPAGEYRDVNLVFIGEGTAEAPITLRAEQPGKAILTGSSTLRIGGRHLVVEGLLFRNPDVGVSDVVMFRKDSKTLASHCRLTNCGFERNDGAAGSKESRWVGIYGEANRVDHCSIRGKTGRGCTVVVWLGGANKGGHRIDANWFGPREPLGKNGGETLRIGDSQTSMLPGNCVVEGNLFEQCNGEAECISSKSCGNQYRGNTFREVSGTLTLRHGNGCLVEKNVFLGNRAPGSGGVRVIGEDHVVRDNYFEDLVGDDARAGLCLMLGMPESPPEQYFQVRRARISGNQLVNCKQSIVIGLSGGSKTTLPPVETVFENNRIVSPKAKAIDARCDLAGVTWAGNVVQAKDLGIPATPGIESGLPPIERPQALSRGDVGTSW